MHFFKRKTKPWRLCGSLRLCVKPPIGLLDIKEAAFRAETPRFAKTQRVSPPELTILIVSYHQAGAK